MVKHALWAGRKRQVALGLAALLGLGLLATTTFPGAFGRLGPPESFTPLSLGCLATPHASISGIATPYTCVDSGLRPDPDGFVFANWGGLSPGEEIDTEEMIRLFGSKSVCINRHRATCTPNRAARNWADQTNAALANGRCEGMSVEAARIFIEPGELRAIDPKALRVAELTRADAQVVDNINYWWATQLMPEVAAAAMATRGLQPSQILHDVTVGLQEGASYTMGLYSQQSGHAVTPFAVTFQEPFYSIWVYDSNNPGVPGRIQVQTDRQIWLYSETPAAEQAADISGRGPGSLEYTPMAVRERTFGAPFGEDSRTDPDAFAITATADSSSADVDLVLTAPTWSVATRQLDYDQLASIPDGVVVRVLQTGSGHGTLAFVRDPEPLTVSATINIASVGFQVTVDGPQIPWVQIQAFPVLVAQKRAARAPFTMQVTADKGITITVAPGAQVEVSAQDDGRQPEQVTASGPATIVAAPNPATGKIQISKTQPAPPT